jgi:hypothetical protein
VCVYVCAHPTRTLFRLSPVTLQFITRTLLYTYCRDQGMLSVATERSLPSTVRSLSLCRTRTARNHTSPRAQVRLKTLQERAVSSSSGPLAFAYLSKKRNQATITIAMSSMTRRLLSTLPPAPSSSSTSKQAAKHPHSHSHDGHDHDHSHGGLFHSHAHDHSEGAQQIMQALTKGQLDRGTRITLLGQFSSGS